jgi:hypothetical protein
MAVKLHWQGFFVFLADCRADIKVRRMGAIGEAAGRG